MKQFFVTILLISSLSLFQLQAQEPNIKEIGQNQYIVHTVTSGESLSEISLIYEVSIDDILSTNTHIKDEDDIRANDILMIPFGKISKAALGDEGIATHTVQKGENLFRISQQYNVTVDEIKEWNSLDDDKIKMGQELIVGVSNRKSTRKNNTQQSGYAQRTNRSSDGLIEGIYHEVEKGETLSSISREYGVSVADLKEWNNLDDDKINAEQLLQVVPNDELEDEEEITEEDFGDAVLDSDDKSAAIEIEYYKVRKGDNLNRIGERYGVHPNQLKELNGLKDANDIYIDQQLVIKKKGVVVEPHPKSEIIIYTVELDDKIEVLAESFDVSEENIRYWNNLSSDDIIVKGQQLKIRTDPETAVSYTTIVEADANLNAATHNPLQKISTDRVMTYGGLETGDNPYNSVDSSKVKKYTVTILHGESLNKIADREKVTVAQIVEWNNLEDPNHIKAGQDLTLYSGLPQPENTSSVDPRILAITEENNNKVADPNAPAKIIAIHKVESGETLYDIEREYKEQGGGSIDEILEANKDIISHEDELQRNMELKIPEHKELKKLEPINHDNGTFHLIQSGESLYSIAEKYDSVSVEDIMKFNKIEDEGDIIRGRVILIPPRGGGDIDPDKVEGLDIAIANAEKFDNPYIKADYIKYLLPEGEDALHDLARDNAENGGINEDSQNFFDTQYNNKYNGPANNADSQNSNPIKSTQPNNSDSGDPMSNLNNSDSGDPMSNLNNSDSGDPMSNLNNSDSDDPMSNLNNSESGDPMLNLDNNSETDDDPASMLMRGQPDESNGADVVDNNTDDTQNSDDDNNAVVNNNNSLPGNAKVVQSGYAQIMSVSGTSRKYVGLHKEAPINSLVTVTNPENGRKAYVMIIDRLTDPVDSDVVIQISETTMNQLNPGADINQKVNIELFYKIK